MLIGENIMNLSNSVYSEPINNTVFERKHHFMYILKEAETLKAQISEELIYGGIEASRLDEINSICNLAFAGLLQEGLAYRYERDTNPNKDAFVITIDHTDYRCRTGALRNILKDKFPEFNTNTRETSPILPLEHSEPLPYQDVWDTCKTHTPVPASVAVPDNSGLSPEVDTVSDSNSVTLNPAEEKSKAADILEPHKAVDSAAPDGREDNADDMLNSFISDILNNKEDDTNKTAEEEYLEVPETTTIEAPTFSKTHQNTDNKNNDVVAESAIDNNVDFPVREIIESPEKNIQIQTPEKQTSEERPAFEVIGATPGAQTFSTITFFKDEREKHKDSFVYQTVRATVRHEGSNKAEEIFFMIAPIDIKKDEISTKIIAYAYLNGKTYAQASIQNTVNGRNTITLCVGEYEFLIRGIFEDYKFSAIVMPDGITVKQNDTFNILDVTNYAPQSGLAQNGHIKFRYETDDKQEGLIEVFPLGIDKENFVVLRQYSEWIDVLRTEQERILTPTIDGLQELVCVWEGDVLKAEFVPAT